jgi:hypothetical protein
MGFLRPKAAKSDNANMGLINSTYGGQMGQGTGATNFLAQLLGVSPGAVSSGANTVGNVANGIAEAGGAQAGYNGFLQQAGFAPAMRQMAQATTGQGAASGLLRSGTTANRLQTRGTELNSQMFNNYLSQLSNLSGLGLQAGGLVANAGQRSTGGRPSTAGSIASAVGGIASIFSDRRLKRDIVKIGEEADGLGIYEFRYLTSIKRVVGVMADEIAKLRPHALGPKIEGYATVNYGAL